jgi:hypothetical protein
MLVDFDGFALIRMSAAPMVREMQTPLLKRRLERVLPTDAGVFRRTFKGVRVILQWRRTMALPPCR